MTKLKRPWSHTALTTFETCPRQYEAKYITKEVAFKDTPATLFGKEVHAALEDAIGKGKPLSGVHKRLQPIVDTVMSKPADQRYVELKIGLAEDGSACEYFDKKVWCRLVIDLLVLRGDTAWVIDWKTGKRKPDSEQLKLFALGVFAKFPHITKVKTMFVWTEVGGEVDFDVYTIDQSDEMWDDFDARLEPLAEAERVGVFAPKPSGLCGAYCDVVRCEHCGKGPRR